MCNVIALALLLSPLPSTTAEAYRRGTIHSFHASGEPPPSLFACAGILPEDGLSEQTKMAGMHGGVETGFWIFVVDGREVEEPFFSLIDF
ncbi:MAG: hypothetical protein K2Q28_15255 [Hyphomicrobium sp.]|nr:hypothetical protein [Hyphomicrobium sp.]